MRSLPVDVKEHHFLRVHLHLEGQFFFDAHKLLLHPDLRDTSLPEIAQVVLRQILGKLKVLPLIQDTSALTGEDPPLDAVIPLFPDSRKPERQDL